MNPKHLITLLLLLVCGYVECFPYYGFFDYQHDGTNYSCDELSATTVSIHIGNSTQSHISVPSQVVKVYKEGGVEITKQYTVVEIGGCADRHNPFSVSLPATVHTIANMAFCYCMPLISVSMPNVENIDSNAFYMCSSLTSVSMPKVRTIGVDGFAGCNSLTSVSMPNVQNIHERAFYDCSSLKFIYIDRLEPPTALRDICDVATYTSARLIVPKEAVGAYRSAFPWSKFFIIGEQMGIESYADFASDNCKRRGFTADGLTKLWISTKDFDIDASQYTITASINGEITDDPTKTGTLGTLTREADGYGFVLTAPDGYTGPENSSSYTIDIELSVEDGKKTYYASVEVWRPGVILLHGLNSSSVCWSRARDYLLESGAYTAAQIVNASYQSSNKVSFDDNTYRYRVVRRNMENLYAQLSAMGIASSRYDLVGHSMGGILSRKYAQEVDAGHVHRILTFDTPHSGSSFGILPEKLNITALDAVFRTVQIKMALNALLSKAAAVHDLNPSSEATAKLNSPQMIAQADGIPCHAVCNVFDGADPNEELDLSKLHKGLRFLPTDIELPLWLLRLVYKSGKNLSNQAGLGFLNAVLGENRHDGVVNCTSQRGGLQEGSTATVFTGYYEGMLGFGSAAHHCNMTTWDLNLQRMLRLLRTPKNDACFARSFAPADLSHRNTTKVRELKANEAPLMLS